MKEPQNSIVYFADFLAKWGTMPTFTRTPNKKINQDLSGVILRKNPGYSSRNDSSYIG